MVQVCKGTPLFHSHFFRITVGYFYAMKQLSRKCRPLFSTPMWNVELRMTWPEPREWKWLHFLPLLTTCNITHNTRPYPQRHGPSLVSRSHIPMTFSAGEFWVLHGSQANANKTDRTQTHTANHSVRKVWKSALEMTIAEHEKPFSLAALHLRKWVWTANTNKHAEANQNFKAVILGINSTLGHVSLSFALSHPLYFQRPNCFCLLVWF